MRLRIASGSAWKSVNVELFRFVLMTTLFTFTCLQYLSMLGCCLHFILFSVENFLEKSDSFLVESVLLLCNLFYTSFLILCHKWPPFVFAGYCILHYALKISLSLALVPLLYWNTPQHFHFPCVLCRVIAETFLLLILG